MTKIDFQFQGEEWTQLQRFARVHFLPRLPHVLDLDRPNKFFYAFERLVNRIEHSKLLAEDRKRLIDAVGRVLRASREALVEAREATKGAVGRCVEVSGETAVGSN